MRAAACLSFVVRCRPCIVRCVVYCFFLQAEDGIRDLVRSRGLGDVYKRQVPDRRAAAARAVDLLDKVGLPDAAEAARAYPHQPVSYTHLTLPTSDLV